MNKQETILGFQVRVAPGSLPPWSPERRKQYLLRPDIRLPLGVDHTVWPLIEDGDPLSSLFDDYVGGPSNSLHVFVSTTIERIDACTQGAVVFLTASEEDASEIKRWGKVSDTSLSLPLLREHGFIRLGYDVAPIEAVWSVLNDTDPGESARTQLAAQFAGSLDSEYGLFTEWEAADQYRRAWKKVENWKTPEGWKETLCPFGIWSRSQDVRQIAVAKKIAPTR